MYNLERNKKKAVDILKSKGYKDLDFINNGEFGLTYQCDNPQGQSVAAKVTFGLLGKKEDVMQEINAADDLKCMKPMDVEKLRPFMNDEQYRKKLKEFKRYNKYINKPVFKFLENDIAVFEAPLATGDLLKDAFTGTDGEIVDKVKKVGRHVLKALSVLHNHDRLHLDIKPNNILKVEQEGKTLFQLADFGLMQPALDTISEKGKIDENDKMEKEKYKVEKIKNENGKEQYKANYLKALAGRGNKDYMAPDILDATLKANSVLQRQQRGTCTPNVSGMGTSNMRRMPRESMVDAINYAIKSARKGNLYYSSPELIKSCRPCTFKELMASDVYSVGLSLYHMYCGVKTNIKIVRGNLETMMNDSQQVEKIKVKADDPPESKKIKLFMQAIFEMCDKDPKKRPTAKKALELPGIAKN